MKMSKEQARAIKDECAQYAEGSGQARTLTAVKKLYFLALPEGTPAPGTEEHSIWTQTTTEGKMLAKLYRDAFYW